MNTKIKTMVCLVALLLIFTATVNAELRVLNPNDDKIKVNGNCYVTLYLNGYIELSRDGIPLRGQNVYMNSLKLTNQGDGSYIGAITSSAYAPAIGNIITIKMKPKVGRLFRTGKNVLKKEIVIGKYTLNKYVKWTYPRPGMVVALKSPRSFTAPQTLKFTWHHFGAPFRLNVVIRNMTSNRVIFNRTVPASAKKVNVSTLLFKKGDRYQFGLKGKNAIGKFKLHKSAAKGSKIDFYYTDIIYVNVK